MISADIHKPVRVACMISGGGRSVVNLQNAIAQKNIPVSIVLVASTRPNVPGIQAAAALGIPTREIPPLPAGFH